MKDMVIDLVDLYILIRKSTENKEIENMVMLNNIYNKLTNKEKYLTNHINKHEKTSFLMCFFVF